MQHDMKTIVVGSSHKRKGGKGHESQCRSWPIMSSIEGKPISAFKFGFEVFEFLQECSHFIYDEVSRRTDHDEDTKKSTKSFSHGWPLKART